MSSCDGLFAETTVIPEPSAYVAAIGLLALMLWPSAAGCVVKFPDRPCEPRATARTRYHLCSPRR